MTPRTGRVFQLRLPPELIAQWQAAARLEGVSLAELVRRSVADRLRYHEEILARLRSAGDAVRRP